MPHNTLHNQGNGGAAERATVRKVANTVRVLERPETPVLPPPPAITGAREAAAVLLQRLLRGRAAQNVMYEGKARRLELITELRMEEEQAALGGCGCTGGQGAVQL